MRTTTRPQQDPTSWPEPRPLPYVAAMDTSGGGMLALLGTTGDPTGTLHVVQENDAAGLQYGKGRQWAACKFDQIELRYIAGWSSWAGVVHEERKVCRNCLAGMRQVVLYGTSHVGRWGGR